MTMAATCVASMSFLKMLSTDAMASSMLTPYSALGNLAWNTLPGKGPKPSLYGATLPVMPSVIIVRPW